MNMLVSVIIVTFNAGKTLRFAIDSVVNQSIKLELIIIDGLSNDNTIDIIKSYGKKIDYWISEKDSGIYDAMNKGWNLANGKYILYLGADDLLLEDSLSKLIDQSDDFDIVYGNTIFKHINEKYKHRKALDLSKICETPICSHQSMIMKKEIIQFFNGFDIKFKILADYDLLLKSYVNNFRFKYIDEYISQFTMGGRTFLNFQADYEKYLIYKKYKLIKRPFLTVLIRFSHKAASAIKYYLLK